MLWLVIIVTCAAFNSSLESSLLAFFRIYCTIEMLVCSYSWHGLGNMASTEAMRLFVKILEVHMNPCIVDKIIQLYIN